MLKKHTHTQTSTRYKYVDATDYVWMCIKFVRLTIEIDIMYSIL